MKLNERSVAHYATCNSPPDKTGFLWKKGERNPAYRWRWCVLKGNMLFYFEERESREPVWCDRDGGMHGGPDYEKQELLKKKRPNVIMMKLALIKSGVHQSYQPQKPQVNSSPDKST